jgi:hypothetical protein
MNLKELQDQKMQLDETLVGFRCDDRDDNYFIVFFLHRIAKSLADIDFTLSQAYKKEKAFHVSQL